MKTLTPEQSADVGYALFCESAHAVRASATIALGVWEHNHTWCGWLLEISGGSIASIKALPLDAPLTLSAESFERLWNTLAHHKPIAALFCTRATFEGLARAKNKLSYLTAVGHIQPYFYRVELQN